MRRFVTAVLCLATLLLGGWLAARSPAEIESYLDPWTWRMPAVPAARPADPWLGGSAPPIAHALGAIDGQAYTNSREAFLASYAAGARVFEVDLAYTRDDVLVATHEWDEAPATPPWRRPTAATFLAGRTRGGHTPLTVADVLELVRAHPDVWLVLDLKDDFEASLADVVRAARGRDSTVLQRIVPQLYDQDDYAKAAALYPWRSYIFTLYRTPANNGRQVAQFVRRHGIGVVTMPAGRVTRAFTARVNAAGALVYAHTVNRPSTRATLRALGVAGIYTDSLF